MLDPRLLGLAGMLVLLTITPGPDTALVARHATLNGRRAALLAASGVCLGLVVHGALASLGLASIMRIPGVPLAIALAGGVYLIWLGVASLRGASRRRLADAEGKEKGEGGGGARDGGRRPLREGLTSNLLNPKIAVFYLSAVAGLGVGAWWMPFAAAVYHAIVTIAWLALVGVVLARTGGARWAAIASGVALVALGAYTLLRAALTLTA